MTETSKERLRLTEKISDLAIMERELEWRLDSVKFSKRIAESDLNALNSRPEEYLRSMREQNELMSKIRSFGRELIIVNNG